VKSRNWAAVLSGHAFDLQDWKEALLSPHDPWAEEWLISDTTRLVLRSTAFDAFEESMDVWNAAKLLI
jgi:hypothetical protein